MMEDSRIIDLYWQRSENAIAETQKKCGRYCHAIANNILRNNEEAEESVNDTYLGAWNSMPPHRPAVLPVFLGKITRQLSLKKRRYRMAEKRGGWVPVLALDELEECIPAGQSIDAHMDASRFTGVWRQNPTPPDAVTTETRIKFMQGEYVVTIYASDIREAWKLIDSLR